MSGLNLESKRVVVTGAAGGLGRAFSEAFARQGCAVMAADINEAGARETAELVRQQGGRAVHAGVDVASSSSTVALAERSAAELGGIDILVNNAAIYAGLERRGFETIEEAVWDRVMAVNVKGAWLMTRAAAPHLRRAGGGSIVNISSATVMSGSPEWLHYVSSKGALIAMTRALARELGGESVTVNALAPGFTLTEASLGLIPGAATYGVDRGAIRRAAGSDDMVGAALFLASPLAGFVTGQTLIVDGGRQFL
jgi:NAD(P)-dependent dehydrogenase (short-subunit alcohol dehydrogenase family)